MLILKAIIATHNKGKIFDITADEHFRIKLQNLDQNSFYIINNVLVCWYAYSQKKCARFDKCSGSVRKISEAELPKYKQNKNSFVLEWDEKKVSTNYDQGNKHLLHLAGFVDSEPILKQAGLYEFWIKNPRNVKILVKYWAEAPPKKIEKGKIFVFTSLKRKNYLGLKSLTITGPWYHVPWKWSFDKVETNSCNKSYDDIQR